MNATKIQTRFASAAHRVIKQAAPRLLNAGCCAVWALAVACAPAQAQPKYPEKPIRLVVGFAPGGVSDVTARMIAEQIGKQLGQAVIVDNRPGANGSTATQLVSKAAPDGYTLLFSGASMYGQDQAYFGKNVHYEPRDFTAITELVRSVFILTVKKDSGFKSVADIVAEARRNPGRVFYASSGNGSLNHLAGVKFEQAFGVKLSHVPYKGGGPAALALLAGETKLGFSTPTSVTQFIATGQLVGLAVTTSTRSKIFPDIPTLVESGAPDFDIPAAFGLFGPANLPKDVVTAIHRAAVTVLDEPALKQRLQETGNEASPSNSPEAYLSQVTKEGRDISTLMLRAGLKSE
jgi:tripartite-type tricarboxylate transporter receptor subunit TctC